MKWNKKKVREFYGRVLNVARCRMCWRSRKDGVTVEVSLPPELRGKRLYEVAGHHLPALKEMARKQLTFHCRICKRKAEQDTPIVPVTVGTVANEHTTTGHSSPTGHSSKIGHTSTGHTSKLGPSAPPGVPKLGSKALLRLMKAVVKPIVKYHPEVDIWNAHCYFEMIAKNNVGLHGEEAWAKERKIREQSAPPRWVDPAVWTQWIESVRGLV